MSLGWGYRKFLYCLYSLWLIVKSGELLKGTDRGGREALGNTHCDNCFNLFNATKYWSEEEWLLQFRAVLLDNLAP